MASIICYHCQNTHGSVREVRECATVPAASATVPTFQAPSKAAAKRDEPITAKQLNFARKLIATKDISAVADQIPNDVREHDELTALESMTKYDARFFIDFLLGLGDKPKASEKVARQLPDVPAGYYAIDGNKGEEDKFYRVDRPTSGKWAGRTFVKVQASGEFYPIRNQDEVARILLEIAVDSAAAQRRYGQKIGRCGICNRPLTDDVSRAVGLGPICRAK